MYIIANNEILKDVNGYGGYTHFGFLEKTEIELSDKIEEVSYTWNQKSNEYEEVKRTVITEDETITEYSYNSIVYAKNNNIWSEVVVEELTEIEKLKKEVAELKTIIRQQDS